MSSKFFMATEYGAPQGRWHFALTRLVEAAEARPRRVSCGCVDQLTGGDVLDDGVEAPLGRRAAQPSLPAATMIPTVTPTTTTTTTPAAAAAIATVELAKPALWGVDRVPLG